jgi:exonuclease III
MKIIAWNVNHQAGKRAIRDNMIPALTKSFPTADIIVLTEYVKGTRHEQVRKALSDANFKSVYSTYVEGGNGVLVATRKPSKVSTAPLDPNVPPRQDAGARLRLELSPRFNRYPEPCRGYNWSVSNA